MLHIWSKRDCPHDFNYEIFVELTSTNSDERVRKFIMNLKQFVRKNGYVRVYSDLYVKKKISKLEYFKNWENMVETA